jgi:hypothetical protein
MAANLKSDRIALNCSDTILEGTGKIFLNSNVFCDVIAVTTEQLKMPSAEKVLMSDCIPAPPPESLPAIVATIFKAIVHCIGGHIISRSCNFLFSMVALPLLFFFIFSGF